MNQRSTDRATETVATPEVTLAPPLLILREQLSTIAGRHAVEMVVLTAFGTLLALTANLGITIEPDRLVFQSPTVAGLLPFLLTLALLWPWRLWRRHGPQWHYYRSLPVSHRQHDRLRTGAGAVYLFGATLVMLALPAAVTLLGDGEEHTRPALWISLLIAPSIVYFFGSALAMRARSALLLLLMAIAGVHLAALLLVPQDGLWRLLTWPLTGPVGLLTALWQPFVHASAVSPPYPAAPASPWLVGALLWLGLSAAVAFFAAGAEDRTGA